MSSSTSDLAGRRIGILASKINVDLLIIRRTRIAGIQLPKMRHGSKAGYSSGVAGVDARRADAPRSEASALGARWLLPARSQPPNYRHLRGWQRGSSRPTPHAPRPMTLGANHVSRREQGGDPAAAVISGLATGPPAGVGDGLRFLSRADNTSVRAGGVLSVRIPRFSTNLNILRSICSDHGDPARAGSDGGPRRFTAVVPTPHAYSGQWPVKKCYEADGKVMCRTSTS